jgi:hypothetical protein
MRWIVLQIAISLLSHLDHFRGGVGKEIKATAYVHQIISTTSMSINGPGSHTTLPYVHSGYTSWKMKTVVHTALVTQLVKVSAWRHLTFISKRHFTLFLMGFSKKILLLPHCNHQGPSHQYHTNHSALCIGQLKSNLFTLFWWTLYFQLILIFGQFSLWWFIWGKKMKYLLDLDFFKTCSSKPEFSHEQ